MAKSHLYLRMHLIVFVNEEIKQMQYMISSGYVLPSNYDVMNEAMPSSVRASYCDVVWNVILPIL